MATPMLSTDFRSIIEPIMNEEFDGIYKQRKDEWKQVFTEKSGIPRAYHEEPVLYGFDAAQEMPEGTPVPYRNAGQLFTQRYIYKNYGLGFALTKILVDDGDHVNIGQIYSRHLAQSMIETKETLGANVLNRAFNGSYTGGDGVSLINTAHPIIGGTFSNRLTTDANLSQTSLEQILIQIRSAVDNNGKKMNLKPMKLVTSPSNIFQGEVLLKSVLRTGSGNNDVNPINSMNMLTENANLTRLTSSTAWFVLTDASEGLKLMMRTKLANSMEGDFDTDSMRYKSTERYAFGWTDPRALWGSPGV